MTRAAFLFSGLLAAAGCTVPATEFGAQLFHDPEFAGSQFNTWSCHTCHATRADDTRLLSGAPMLGVTLRSGWYGGRSPSLFDAVQTCYVAFMRGDPMTREDDRSRALYEYLATLDGPADETLPFTITSNAADVPRGDPGIGKDIYTRACLDCHGALHTGEGRNSPLASLLPEVTNEYDTIFPGTPHAVVVVEKVRHGQFFGVGGNMPLYSQEALTDDQLGSLLAYLGL